MIEKLFLGIAYLSNGIIGGTVSYIAFFFIRYVINGKNILRNPRWIVEYLFFIYAVSVGFVTRIFAFSTWSLGGGYSFNLIPFVKESLILMILNSIMFLPLGIFIPMIVSTIQWSYKNMILIGGMTSVMIEVIQVIFAGRMGDIDDIIFNMLGTIIGFTIYKIGRKIFRNEKLGFGTQSLGVVLVGILLEVPVFGVSVGDLLLEQWRIPSWSENTPTTLAFQGVHYTMIIGMILSSIAFIMAKKHRSDYGAKVGAIAGVLSFVSYGFCLMKSIC